MDEDTRGKELAESDEAPSPSSIRDYLLYGLSLPGARHPRHRRAWSAEHCASPR